MELAGSAAGEAPARMTGSVREATERLAIRPTKKRRGREDERTESARHGAWDLGQETDGTGTGHVVSSSIPGEFGPPQLAGRRPRPGGDQDPRRDKRKIPAGDGDPFSPESEKIPGSLASPPVRDGTRCFVEKSRRNCPSPISSRSTCAGRVRTQRRKEIGRVGTRAGRDTSGPGKRAVLDRRDGTLADRVGTGRIAFFQSGAEPQGVGPHDAGQVGQRSGFDG